MKKEQFYVGQRVKIYDDDEECMIYGHVKEIKEKSVIIDWHDMKGIEHFEEEFPSIKIGNPGN